MKITQNQVKYGDFVSIIGEDIDPSKGKKGCLCSTGFCSKSVFIELISDDLFKEQKFSGLKN
jgi:hypothetical protein